MKKIPLLSTILSSTLLVAAPCVARAQTPSAGRVSPAAAEDGLSLRRAVARALHNSREVALARAQYAVAAKTADFSRAQFRPNVYAGSGLGYTRGYPQTPSGGPPAIFSVTTIQTLFNAPLKGELRAAEERAEAQRLAWDAARDAVIVRTASAYLELAKVRGSLEYLRRERQSAQLVVDVTRERLAAGVELPIEVTRAQLSSARVEQRIVQLEGREETLEAELHSLMGSRPDERIEVAAQELPAAPELSTRELVTVALAENTSLKQAEAERRAREHRMKGERGGFWPSIDVVSQYGLLARFNNFDQVLRTFRRNNLTVGLDVRMPIFSSRAMASAALARTSLDAAEIEVKVKRSDVQIEVRQKARRTREVELGREVARLELQIAQENLRVLQSQHQEGRASLRDLEKARLEESDKWLAFLDADYERQQAQLELLRVTGQLARVFQ